MSEYDEGSSGSETVDTSSGMDDYFGQVELINDDGTPLDSDNGNAVYNEPQQSPQATAQPTNNNQNAATGPTPAPMNHVLKTGIYNEAGEFDLAKATDFFKRTGAFKYEKPAPTAPSQQSATAATVPAAEAPKSWRDEYSAYEQNIKTNVLGALEQLWEENLNAGIPQNNPAMLNIQARYQEKLRDVEAHLQSKRNEFEDKYLDTKLSAKEQHYKDMETSAKAQAIQSTLAQEAGGIDAYNELMFGAADQNGNFVQGPGAEIINFLYDQQIGGVQQTPEEMQAWWRNFSANEANARTVFKMASAIHLQHNFDNVLSSARTEWERGAQERRQGNMRSPGGHGNPAAIGGGGGSGMDPALARFAGTNQPQIM